ncbi:division/outer membrane stress-associated lipid-binding lipoprotein [Rodentibacter myodis]|uniref:Osmotically-inducible protein OsmY n=1 Tax=Rodentibacter myodis TaxID=1907939 RepID=A0A1V3JQF7_9PAST|nr:division/outer membrane stress-associated lipid-binding lipoprotein [Rodentibacter myodis]OOF59046.1 osmotically-inducible protein OsmY [Rodentibacter myodis]
MKLASLKKLAFVLGTTVLLQGCAAALIGGVAAGTTKVATDPRTMGTQVDDETLEIKVENAIDKDEQIESEARVNAISYSGRVLLIGQVPSESAKETATDLAKGVEGVSDVYNELRIGAKIGIGQITKDSWITTQVKSKMLVDDRVKSTDVKVLTENGEVFLLGNLTQAQADAAADIASKVSGVQKVVKVFKYLN